MGNLLGGVSFREPTTVEDCDSTWQTDSEPEPEPEPEPEQQPGPAGGGEGQEHDEPEQPEQPPERAGGRPRASPVPEDHAEAGGAEQVNATPPPPTQGGPGRAKRPGTGEGTARGSPGMQGGRDARHLWPGYSTWGSLRWPGSPEWIAAGPGPCCEHHGEVPQGKPRLH